MFNYLMRVGALRNIRSLFICLITLPLLHLPTYAQQAGQIQVSRIPAPDQHYLPEYTLDEPSAPEEWGKQKKGLNVSFASIDELYLRREVPQIQETLTWKKTGWRGERLNAQILVWSPDSIDQVRVTLNDLKNAAGKIISSENNLDVQLVRYVLSNYPYAATNAQCDAGPGDVAWLVPDRFEDVGRFDLPGNSVRPLWLTLEIPAGADPGEYTGTIVVQSQTEKVSLTVSVNVQAMDLPTPKDWSYRLDLWQNPWVVAEYYHVKPWSDEHKLLLKKHLQLYADAGGKYITTYAVHSPWSDNSYRLEGGMIEWIKGSDNQWRFDYSIFDQYVTLAMEVGIEKAITIYTPIPWGYRFRYLDEKSGNYVYGEWSPKSEEFKKYWKIFLDDLQAHLKEKGWYGKTYLGINENPLDVTLAAAQFIKAHSREWKITYAGDWHPELTDLLDDYCPVISSEPSPAELTHRKSKGFTTTYYVCCTPSQPNNFVFSTPAEGTFISWYAASYQYDGFLRWAYDAWPADPMRDARHIMWPAGDCFLVYPGGKSSIRFERLREGIVDFEKINILRKKASASPDKAIKKSMESFEKYLSDLSKERNHIKRDYSPEKVKESLRLGKLMIENLSNELSKR